LNNLNTERKSHKGQQDCVPNNLRRAFNDADRVTLLRITQAGPGNLIYASGALPIDNVNQFPWILRKLELKLSLFVHSKLALGIENAGAFFLIGVVN
jgi:hypothetical protein